MRDKVDQTKTVKEERRPGDLKEVKEAERLRKCIAESMPAAINVVNICALSLHWWRHQQAEANIMPVLRP